MPRHFLSLRWRVIALLVVVIAPLFAVAVFDAAHQRASQLRESEEQMLSSARAVAANQQQVFQTTELLLNALAQHDEVIGRHEDAEACARWMSTVSGIHPLYANLGVIEPDGSVSCSAVPLERTLDLRDRYYFQGAMEPGEFTIGDYQVGRITGLPTINAGYPLRDASGEPEAVVFAALDLAVLSQVGVPASLPPGASLLIVDQLGTLLAQSPGEQPIGESYSGTPLVRAAQATTEAREVRVAGLDGESVVAGIAPVTGGRGSRAFVVTSVPESTVVAAVNAAFLRNLVMLTTVSVGALLLAWFGAQRLLLRPLERLRAAADRLSKGERHLSLGPPYGAGEVGTIQATFDRMMAALDARESELVAAEVARFRSEAQFGELLDQASDAIIVADGGLKVRRVNRGAEAMFGISTEEFVNQSLMRVVPERLTDGYGRSLRQLLQQRGEGRRFGEAGQLRLLRSDGTEFPVEVAVSVVEDVDQIALLLIVRDTTLQQEAQEALHRRAYFDELTDLPNRAFFLEAVGAQIEMAPHEPFALFAVDLPRLREVNATFGYLIGDEVLRQAGPRMAASCGDGARVAKLDGARYAVVVPRPVGGHLGFRDVAARLVQEAQAPFDVHGEPIALEAWVGVALYPGHGNSPELLLRRADAALAVAPDLPGGYATYAEQRDGQRLNHVQLLSELRRALDDGVLELHYQPRVDLTTGEALGAEALLRWPGGPSPADFIPLAERTGLIRRIDDWVLEMAVRQAATWQRDGMPVLIGINLSARAFQDEQLPARLGELLDLWGVPPDLIELEITETVLMNDPERAMSVCVGLRGMGVRLAIDDFGAGHSPLTYLHRMPVSTLKIDRSFVSGLLQSEETMAIVDAVVELGRRLQLTLVAEGVEDQETADRLRDMGCPTAQGFFFCRPGPPDTVGRWLGGRLPGRDLAA